MKDQVAIVTGASRGIGRAIAVRLAQAQARVVAVARSAAGLRETCRLAEQAGGTCLPIEADVTNFQAVERIVQHVTRELRRVDVLINNAGTAPMSQMKDFDVGAFDAMMALNCNAVFYTTRAVWPSFAQQGGGRIVNISSIAAVDPFPGFQAYGATKAWVNAFTKAVAEEGRPHNIRAFAVAPGAVDTQMLRDRFPDFPADQCLTPQEVADTVAWVLDPRSQHASGAVVYIKK